MKSKLASEIQIDQKSVRCRFLLTILCFTIFKRAYLLDRLSELLKDTKLEVLLAKLKGSGIELKLDLLESKVELGFCSTNELVDVSLPTKLESQFELELEFKDELSEVKLRFELRVRSELWWQCFNIFTSLNGVDS